MGLRQFFIRPVAEISQFYMQLTGNTLPIASPRLQYKRAKVYGFFELDANMLGGQVYMQRNCTRARAKQLLG